jgi:hypothetical protein
MKSGGMKGYWMISAAVLTIRNFQSGTKNMIRII